MGLNPEVRVTTAQAGTPPTAAIPQDPGSPREDACGGGSSQEQQTEDRATHKRSLDPRLEKPYWEPELGQLHQLKPRAAPWLRVYMEQWAALGGGGGWYVGARGVPGEAA